jgi:hypothetical protein
MTIDFMQNWPPVRERRAAFGHGLGVRFADKLRLTRALLRDHTRDRTKR